DPSLTNEMIAAHFHYHPYYIRNLKKQQTGETLHQYLLRYRIRIAKNKLITTDADIGTIAWKCGFNTAAYFIKTFKTHTGLTPKQYRKKNMENF
ncbi:MAG: helix-turn-helix transcriptional regulator, partial [Clostridia bacterium]|nr:helix-turn-helix transcriptional regulator [Clostridia bacterium]